MKKRIISAALAALMAVSVLSTAAFADDPANDGSLTASSITALPTLKVTMPKSIAFIINPYNLTVDAKGKAVAAGTEGAYSGEVIAAYGTGNTSWDLINNSGIKIGAKMYVVASTEATDIAINPTGDTWKADKKKIAFKIKAGVKTAGEGGVLGDATSVTEVPVLSAAPANWGVSASIASKEIPDKGALSITLTDGDTEIDSSYATGAWAATDVVNLAMAFKFDFIANPTS